MSDEEQPRPPSSGDLTDKELFWKFLGLQVARRTEFVALSAFILSLGGILFQIWGYMRGPDISLFPPDLVTIASTKSLKIQYEGEPNQVRFIASSVAYVNTGEIGQNGIIRREYIKVGAAGDYLRHVWDKFVNSDMSGNEIVLTKKESASPFPVNGGAAVSHETLFAPWELDCPGQDPSCKPSQEFVTWDYFMDFVKTHHDLSVTINTEMYPAARSEAKCQIQLRNWEIEDLAKYQWLSVVCHPEKM